ncbi:MAG: hypothetical protein V3R61_02660 [candidate division NC10 bacterium]
MGTPARAQDSARQAPNIVMSFTLDTIAFTRDIEDFLLKDSAEKIPDRDRSILLTALTLRIPHA